MSSVPYLNHFRRRPPPSFPSEGAAEGRASSRNRRAAVTGGASAVARLVQIGASLATIPIAIRYLGNERFGLWMTINSVLAMASFADFGIGFGVLNHVAGASGRDDMEGVRRAVSSGFAVLGGISIALLAVLCAAFRFVPWADLFRVSSPQARAEAGPALMVFAACFALNIPMDIVQRVQLGLQQGYRYSLWQLSGSALGLAGVVAAVWRHAGLPALVAAVAGAPLLATACNAVHFFGFVRPELRPAAGWVTRKAIAEIARLGGMFFVLQAIVAISFSADNLIVARVLGAGAVAAFSVPQRMFSFVGAITTMLLVPLWPAYGEAVARGDLAWVERTLWRTLLGILVLTSAISAALALLSHRLLLWWVGPSIQPPSLLIAGFAVWAVMQCVSGALLVFLNAASILRLQVLLHCAFGGACVAAKLWAARRYGIAALPWATLLLYAPLVALPTLLYVPRLIVRMAAEPRKGDCLT